jgi:predicted nicotinamide N-methyase
MDNNFQSLFRIIDLLQPGISLDKLETHLGTLRDSLRAIVKIAGVDTTVAQCDSYVRSEARSSSLRTMLVDYLSKYPEALGDVCDSCINLLTYDRVACGATRGKEVMIEISSSVAWEIELGDFYDDWTGCRVWPGAIHLSNILLSGEFALDGSTVLELGSGMGICSIACVHAGVDRVFLTEYQPNLLKVACSNVNRNIPADACDKVSGFILDWDGFDATSHDEFRKFEACCDDFVFVASEVVYETAHADLINAVLNQLFQHGASRGIIVVMLKPSRVGLDRFVELMTHLPSDSSFSCNFRVDTIDTDRQAAVFTLARRV